MNLKSVTFQKPSGSMDVKSGPDDEHKSKEAMDVSGTAEGETTQEPEMTKRNASEVTEGNEEGDEDGKRKKRKDSNGNASSKSFGGRNTGSSSGKCIKNYLEVKSGNKGASGGSGADRKSPSNAGGSSRKCESDGEDVRSSKPASTSDSGTWAGGLKVPPLKIVIPQQSSSSEQDRENRNGKTGAGRHHLPYVVTSTSSSSEPMVDKEGSGGAGSNAGDDKKDGYLAGLSDDQRPPRILRSSHRSGTNNQPDSSPTAPSSSGSPDLETSVDNASPSADTDQPSPMETEPIDPEPTISTSTTAMIAPSADEKSSAESSGEQNSQPPVQAQQQQQQQQQQQTQQLQSTSQPAVQTNSNPVQLHPRKRKIKQNRDSQVASSTTPTPTPAAETPETSSAVTEPTSGESSVPNSYQSFRNIRKQVDRRRKGLFPVQPKPPQGFKDYLMNRCTYLLAGNAANCISVSMASPPPNLQAPIKSLFIEQEKERRKLQMQHIVEKEKLVLAVEQEILRVHGRAARALANQSLPFSVCTILKDEEIYNEITPEQEEKDRNARSRYNGRLFLSWLQDVDDKWEKIKEGMLNRHHCEAASLRGIQCMDWEWKMKELGLCEQKASPVIDETCVPLVHVSDDFNLLPT